MFAALGKVDNLVRLIVMMFSKWKLHLVQGQAMSSHNLQPWGVGHQRLLQLLRLIGSAYSISITANWPVAKHIQSFKLLLWG